MIYAGVISDAMIEDMKILFLEFMQKHGWVAGVEGKEVRDMRDFRVNTFSKGLFLVRETYGIPKVAVSRDGDVRIDFSRAISISYKEKKAWFMEHKTLKPPKVQKTSFCREEDLPFLKLALMQAYKEGKFVGGCGLVNWPDERLSYENKPVQSGFTLFSGHDKIHTNGVVSEIFGLFEYHGGIITART